MAEPINLERLAVFSVFFVGVHRLLLRRVHVGVGVHRGRLFVVLRRVVFRALIPTTATTEAPKARITTGQTVVETAKNGAQHPDDNEATNDNQHY